jgi:hypothetical protein
VSVVSRGAGSAPPRLALRFAVYTAIGLAIAAACILTFVRHFGTKQAERAATLQARYIAETTLADGLRPRDFEKPVDETRQSQLDELFREDVLLGSVLSATLYSPAGVVTYSVDPAGLGSRAVDPGRVQESLEGQIVTDIRQTREDGIGGRDAKTLRTFVPVKFAGSGRSGVVAIYLDYAPIARAAHEAFLPIAGVLEVVLILLYLALVPFLRRASIRMREQMQEIEYRALHDDLTGLPNRVLFQTRIEEVIHESKRRGVSAAVLLIDLDRFKEINDTLGHHTGDLMLKELGMRLAGRASPTPPAPAHLLRDALNPYESPSSAGEPRHEYHGG